VHSMHQDLERFAAFTLHMQKLTEINDELFWCSCIGLGNQLPSMSTGGAFLTSSLEWDFFFTSFFFFS